MQLSIPSNALQWSYKTTTNESQTFYPVFKDNNTLK